MAKIYLATSWRNPYHGIIRRALMHNGHEVHDFKADDSSFWWGDLLPDKVDHENLPPSKIKDLLGRSQVRAAFEYDREALDEAEVGVVLQPAGRSAHLEVGYMAGQGKPIHVLFMENDEPDTMHLLAGIDNIHTDEHELLTALEEHDDG